MQRLLFLFCFVGAISGYSQTTLSGDHIVTGDLNVGVTGTTGNLQVTGDTGNTAPPGLKVTGDGGVVFSGSFGTGKAPTSGGGTMLMWFPKKGAFRVGSVGNTGEWDEPNIGNYSTALGTGWAKGSNSVVLGYGSALGDRSTSMAGNAEAHDSVAMSWSTVRGRYGTAMSRSTANGYASVAISESLANANYSVAICDGNTFGEYSTAVNAGTTLGTASFAVGGISEGQGSMVFGLDAYSKAAYSFVVGRNNVIQGDSSIWAETDPLFVVGNGTGDPGDAAAIRNRNAFTVYKNGNVIIPKRQGDILMGEFGNPE